MAGGDIVKFDPAIERWSHMREDVYKHFRFTTRTARVGFVGLILIPGALWYYASQDDTKWNWNAKRRGESLRRVPLPPPPTSSDEPSE